ncbi:unnamed protein product [Rodentolepis nana]|uniref:Protein kinase domain-containing protein n=1 Tax=Rodentolepis nana TaxID=102285 RepID=A0A0R3TL03_RODNA|nr:unnamed protein product [Rodentolepis nana]
MKKFTADIYYMAPEIANEIEITEKADIWQLGMLAATLIAGNIRPTNDKSKLLEMAKSGSVNIRTLALQPLYFWRFITACLEKDPKIRPSIAEIKKFTFIKVSGVRCTSSKPINVVGLSSYDLYPYSRGTLAAATNKGFPNIKYLKESPDGVRLERLLPYTRPNLLDLERSQFSMKKLKILPEFAEYPVNLDLKPEESNEETGPRRSKRPRNS